jgi:hypothetical protein
MNSEAQDPAMDSPLSALRSADRVQEENHRVLQKNHKTLTVLVVAFGLANVFGFVANRYTISDMKDRLNYVEKAVHDGP